MQQEIIRSQSVTESLVLVAVQIFGKKDGTQQEPDFVIKDAAGMQDFVKRLQRNG